MCQCGKCVCNSEWDSPGKFSKALKNTKSNLNTWIITTKTKTLIHFPIVFHILGYTACECRASNDTCITPWGEFLNQLCSGHGTCECGKCKCQETADGQYSGQFCEDCPVCLTFLHKVFYIKHNLIFIHLERTYFNS